MVCWLPALFRMKNFLYYFIKGKERLSALVRKKSLAVVALTAVSKEDQKDLVKLSTNLKVQFNDDLGNYRCWDGGVTSIMSYHVF
eukprot:8105975-Heterocapsa_arctica.AAC.1